MKTRSLILIGLLSCLFFAVALLPASLVWRSLGSSLTGLPLVAEQVGGTLWKGFVLTRIQDPLAAGPLVVQWDLKALRLLMGEVALDMKLEGGQYRLQGSGYWGLWGKGVTGMNGDVKAAMLEQTLSGFGVSAQGEVKVVDVSVGFSGNRVTSATGNVNWSGGPVSVSGGPQNLDFPGIKGELGDVEGDLIVAVTETRGNQPLGELSLMPEQGLAGVKVLRRVMSLAGMGSGDEDKVLLNLQQPLPF
jgi:hypothetical protein